MLAHVTFPAEEAWSTRKYLLPDTAARGVPTTPERRQGLARADGTRAANDLSPLPYAFTAHGAASGVRFAQNGRARHVAGMRSRSARSWTSARSTRGSRRRSSPIRSGEACRARSRSDRCPALDSADSVVPRAATGNGRRARRVHIEARACAPRVVVSVVHPPQQGHFGARGERVAHRCFRQGKGEAAPYASMQRAAYTRPLIPHEACNMRMRCESCKPAIYNMERTRRSRAPPLPTSGGGGGGGSAAIGGGRECREAGGGTGRARGSEARAARARRSSSRRRHSMDDVQHGPRRPHGTTHNGRRKSRAHTTDSHATSKRTPYSTHHTAPHMPSSTLHGMLREARAAVALRIGQGVFRAGDGAGCRFPIDRGA